jgi:membrane protease subunit HflK
MFARLFLASLFVGYVCSGVYLIRGNEQGVVRRFGRLDPQPRAGGLHFDWPWPFARVDRVNRSEARTIGVGFGSKSDPTASRTVPMQPVATQPAVAPGKTPDANVGRDPLRPARQPEYLTGDKNILHVQVQVQFTITDPAAWLFRNLETERLLERRVESLLVDRIAECGVDYVHPVGLPALQRDLLAQLRTDPLVTSSGIAVEDVSIPQISPPIEVKAAFLDVSSARAEREETIAREAAAGERRVSAAQAQSQTNLDAARSQATTGIQSAMARSESLSRLLDSIGSADPATTGPEQVRQRELVMNRLFLEFLEVTFPKLKRVAFVAPGTSTDLLLPGLTDVKQGEPTAAPAAAK